MARAASALPATPLSAERAGDMHALARRQSSLDRSFHLLTLACALLVLALLGGVILTLIYGSIPVFQAFGLGFLTNSVWNPVTEQFGALAPVYGTVMTSIIAILVGVPLSFGVAMFITELCPPALKRPLSIAIELLAGIPSIIYGIWGLFVFAPFMQSTVQPFLIATLGNVPGIGQFFKGPPYGLGILTAGLILAIMILPFISSVMRDVFETVPPMLRESAYGLGATTWEVMWRIVLPYSSVGVTGGIMLGLGRALGETMAVTFVIGNAHRIATSLLAPGTTISASIANEFTEALGELYSGSLIALGLILFAITFVVLGIAKYLLIRMQKRAGV